MNIHSGGDGYKKVDLISAVNKRCFIMDEFRELTGSKVKPVNNITPPV